MDRDISSRSQAINDALKKLVVSPRGTIEVPIQEFKRLLQIAGIATARYPTIPSASEAADIDLVDGWRRRIIQMGAP